MDGIINVLKPAGITSRQVATICKRITKEKKVGHGGTLDPGAAGVLPVMVGKATRLFDILGEEGKQYIGELCFGIATDTQDSYGKILDRSKVGVTREQLEAVLPSFLGAIRQTPSCFSAVHVQGKRAYELARAGRAVELPPRTVTIQELELLHQTGENRFLVRVRCSKGTYIRSLCADIARACGTIGCLTFLLRTQTGRFTIENAITLDELEHFQEDHLTGLEDILGFLPRVSVRQEFAPALYNGNKLGLECCVQGMGEGTHKIYDHQGRLCGLGVRDHDMLRMKINLRGT